MADPETLKAMKEVYYDRSGCQDLTFVSDPELVLVIGIILRALPHSYNWPDLMWEKALLSFSANGKLPRKPVKQLAKIFSAEVHAAFKGAS